MNTLGLQLDDWSSNLLGGEVITGFEDTIDELKKRIPITPLAVGDSFCHGTTVSGSYIKTIDYLWDNHSPLASIYETYLALKEYEDRYDKDSETILNEWKKDKLEITPETSDWITSYLQIKDFIKN